MPKRHILAPHQPDVVRLAADQHPTPRAGMLIRHLHDSQPATARAGLLTRHHSEAGQVEQQRRSVFHRVASRVIDLRHRSAWEATPISSRYDTRSLTIYRGVPLKWLTSSPTECDRTMSAFVSAGTEIAHYR